MDASDGDTQNPAFDSEPEVAQEPAPKLPPAEPTDASNEENGQWATLELATRVFGAIGRALSAPDGKPTPFGRILEAFLVVYPLVFFFFGFDGSGITTMYADPVFLTVWVGLTIFFVACGPCAFRSVRAVTLLPTGPPRFDRGHLEQLGWTTTAIPASAISSLRRWSAAIITLVVLMVLGLTGTFIATGELSPRKNDFIGVVMWIGFLDICFIGVAAWWISVKIASALANAQVLTVAHAAEAVLTSLRHGDAFDDAAWITTVRDPSLRLARVTLPLLSKGWGNALGFVGGGFLALACAFLVLVISGFIQDAAMRGPLVWLSAMFSAIPCMLADDPANVSSKAHELRGILNRIINHDLSLDLIVAPLLATLARENNDQGIGARSARCFYAPARPRAHEVTCTRLWAGFRVFGNVINRRTIWLTATSIWGILLTVGPLMMDRVMPDELTGGGGSGVSLCPYSWAENDGSCFKYFGGDTIWYEAEAQCQTFGAHLATIDSAYQNRMINAMFRAKGGDSTQIAGWIGLTAEASPGTFVWADGEPLEYSNWAGSQPQNPGGPAPQSWACADGRGADFVYMNLNDGWMSSPAYGNWANEKPMRGTPAPHAPGCFEHIRPFICSKPAAPPHANGGRMYGCINGHWLQGVPHHSDALPPTVVRSHSSKLVR
jgi:hypothetical protein